MLALEKENRKIPMTNPAHNDNFCWGHYESTIDGGSRLRLNSDIIRIFDEHQVCCVWIFPSPAYPALIICPEQMHKKYVEHAKTILPEHMDPAIAHRKYLSLNTATVSSWKNCSRNPDLM